MNKFEFIKDLLETKKFNSNQKDRFIRLVSSEFANLEAKDSKILADIKAIKEKIGLLDVSAIISGEEKAENEKYLKEFLSKVNLKYLKPTNKNIDPRSISLNERMSYLSMLTFDGYNDNKSILERIKDKYEGLDSENALKSIERQYLMVKQIEILKGDYVPIGISNDTYIIPPGITKDLVERTEEAIKKTNDQKNENREEQNNDNNFNDLTYYYPLSTYKFLFSYNQNRILKSTCHDIGSEELKVINNYCNTEEYDFYKHLEKIKEAYDSHEKNFAPSFLKTRFRVYLTGKNYYEQLSKGWSEESIKVNWSSSTLKEWSEKNPGIPPNLNDALIEKLENTGFENFESFTSNISGVSVQSFTELVKHFKHSFHLNGDNPLRAIIERTNNLNNWNEHIDFIIGEDSFPSNIEHFTDVDKLIQAYKSIIELIVEISNKYELDRPKVKITAKISLEEFQLSIHHLNSTYKKTISNTLERTGQHYRNLIENQINGLCNLILKAEFESDPKSQINIWDGKERKPQPIKDENFKGVEHIFQFPKK
jgi:antitoxin component of MazEF toxin-antitoxin module